MGLDTARGGAVARESDSLEDWSDTGGYGSGRYIEKRGQQRPVVRVNVSTRSRPASRQAPAGQE